ncbi:branched-chain amino acid ABC transporter permease [Mesorhizobium loti]|nr:branched-chain amino acid ABC transporter permease [Mesorhizobium loti]PLP56659.1 branched-chain amino acid ABC transporter permease [Mesorhizobium loti]
MSRSDSRMVLWGLIVALLIAVAMFQDVAVALTIAQLCLISALMALGINLQWGYAGLFNAGVMGFAALGGLAATLVSVPPVREAWALGGAGIAAAAIAFIATVAAIVLSNRKMSGWPRVAATLIFAVVGYAIVSHFLAPAILAVESHDAAQTGYLGGLGLPVMWSWPVGGLLAAGAAWLVGRITLGLRADYLAIATLGIAEIIIAVLKNEEWLTRGVKNVTGLSRPVPFEIDLQQEQWFQPLVSLLGGDGITAAAIFVKLAYLVLFALVLAGAYFLAERALHSPWGRMMRAIRDDREAAAAMGKDVSARHLQIFVLGSALIGIAGAMLTTLDGQFTPGAYNPLRFTFLIWVMVIVGGAGSNMGAVLGSFFVWFTWIEAEPLGQWLANAIVAGWPADSLLRIRLLDVAPHLRLVLMGLVLLLVMRFRPAGLIPMRG